MPEPEHVDFDPAESKAERRARLREEMGLPPAPPRPKVVDLVPKLPPLEVDMQLIQQDPDQRAVACVNLRLQGAQFHEIAKELGYASATAAKSAYIAALANMNPPEDWETLRRTEQARAEAQLRRSTQMANAEYLVVHNEDGSETRIPNSDRLRWHEQAGKDLMAHAIITGAKAPARVEVSADTEELNELVRRLADLSGAGGDIEADILALEELEAEIVDEED